MTSFFHRFSVDSQEFLQSGHSLDYILEIFHFGCPEKEAHSYQTTQLIRLNSDLKSNKLKYANSLKLLIQSSCDMSLKSEKILTTAVHVKNILMRVRL